MSSDDSASLATPYADDMSQADVRHPSHPYPRQHQDEIMTVLEYSTPIHNPKPAVNDSTNYRYGLGDFVFHRTLGTGSFGRVHLGTYSKAPRA